MARSERKPRQSRPRGAIAAPANRRFCECLRETPARATHKNASTNTADIHCQRRLGPIASGRPSCRPFTHQLSKPGLTCTLWPPGPGVLTILPPTSDPTAAMDSAAHAHDVAPDHRFRSKMNVAHHRDRFFHSRSR